MTSVKGILRGYDRGAFGEAFRGDRLEKISVLGRGSTSTVWMVVDVDTLMIVAVKEMIVNDSKQSAVLRHELTVLNPQLQLDIRSRGVTRGYSNRRARAMTPRNLPVSPLTTAATNAPHGFAPRRRRLCGVSDSGDSTSGGNGGGNRSSSGGDQAHRERRCPCPHMPRYFGSFVSHDASGRPTVSIVLEHIAGVDLGRWIHESGAENSPPPEQWLACVCRDLVEALRYLHERRRIHRDVKPANVLLTPCGAKLADFGSTVEEEDGTGLRMHGTIRFMSPERLMARQYRPSSDLWAAGLTIAVAALGENPIPHCSEFDAVEHAMAAFDKVAAHPRASRLSPELLDFLRVVLVADPDKRPTAEEMLEHPFVRQAVVGYGGSSNVGEGDVNCSRGGCGGGDDFPGFKRGGFGLGLDGRKRRAERTGAQEEKDEQLHAVGGGGTSSRSNSYRASPCCCGSSNGAGGGCGAGAGEAGSRDGGEEWKEAVQQRLRNLRRKYVPPVDASDVVRRVLAARRSRWGHSDGSSRAGLEKLDFSNLAAELGMGTAGLRSLFGTVATNMDGCINTGSWSSPAPSTGSSELTSGSSSRDAETERDRPQLRPMPSPSPLPSPSRARLPRSPLPRRRPPPLIVSPARPRTAMEMIPQSAPASPVLEERVDSVVRGMSAVWIRAWPGRHRRHTIPETLREVVVPRVEENSDEGGIEGEGDVDRTGRSGMASFPSWRARSGIAWGRGNAGAGSGGWWRRRGFRLHRMFKRDKNSRVTIVVEPGTTEVPSPPRPDEMPEVVGYPLVPERTRDRDDDGVRRGEGESVAGLGAGTAVERCGVDVDHGLGRVAGVDGQRFKETTLLAEAMTGVLDGPAPAWGLRR